MPVGAWAPPVSGGSVTGLSATDAWHRAEPVMGHVQHLSLESLVKMDHFQNEPPLNLKGTPGAPKGVERGQYLKDQNPAVRMSALGRKQTFAPQNVMSALAPKADMCGALAHVCFGPIDGVIGRRFLWIAEDFGCCASGCWGNEVHVVTRL